MGCIFRKHIEERQNQNSLEAYQGVLDENLLFFIPKWNLPKFIIKLYTIGLLFKENWKLWKCKRQQKFVIRETNIHRKPQQYLCINDARVYLNTEDIDDVMSIIYSKYREIIHSVIKSSKKNFRRFSLNKLLPVRYIRIYIYDSDMRLRQYHKTGLKDSLICTIGINTTKRIKNIEILGGTLENLVNIELFGIRVGFQATSRGTKILLMIDILSKIY